MKIFLLKHLPFSMINLLRQLRGTFNSFFYRIVPYNCLSDRKVGHWIKYNSVANVSRYPIENNADTRWGKSFAFYKHRFNSSDEINLLWVDGPSPGNFGDWLSPFILSEISRCDIGHVADYKNCNFEHILGVGSIAIKANKFSHVMGSGIAFEDERLCPTAKYHFVRGPYTNKAILNSGGRPTDVMGDPGFLMPKLLPLEKRVKSKELLLVRHISHKRLEIKMPDNMTELSISAAHPENVIGFVNELASARVVITSAMHCHIVCVAYGIPSVLINFDSPLEVYGDGIKYLDAMEGVGLRPKMPITFGLDLRRISFDDHVDIQSINPSVIDDLYQKQVEVVKHFIKNNK